MMRGTYLITGVTGFIGASLAKHIVSSAEYSQGDIQIVGIVRDYQKGLEQHVDILDDKFQLLTADITNYKQCYKLLNQLNVKIDYIIHCASPTRSRFMTEHPVETADVIVQATKNMLQLADAYKIKRMIYLSSMEVYGCMDGFDDKKVTEDEMGYVNIFDTRSCYPLAKRMAEHYCYTYFKEYEVSVVIARLAQTFGEGLLKDESRVFAEFARAVKNKADIILHTTGESMGNYCGIEDVISAIELLLEKGKDGEAYNVVNESNTMRIKDMAQLVIDEFGEGTSSIVFDISKDNTYGYARETKLQMSGEKLAKLGCVPKTPLKDMYSDVMKSIE